ncbi:MAG: hypothetical protein Fur0041_18850 [Bacteroidia bacterium]
MQRPIRIGFLINSFEMQSWEIRCILKMFELPFVKPVIVVMPETTHQPAKSLFQKIKGFQYSRLLWKLYNKYGKDIDAYRTANAEKLFQGCKVISCNVIRKGKYAEYFPDDVLEQIRHSELDVLIRFGFNIIKGEILNIPQNGVWSYHHCDEQYYRGGPAGFWEIYKNDPVTGFLLQRLTEQLDAGHMIRKGWVSTIRHSYRANTEQILRASESAIQQALTDLYNNTIQYTPVHTSAPVFRYPNNWQMLNMWLKLAINKFRFHFRELFLPEKWAVGIIHQSFDDILKNGIQSEIQWKEAGSANEYLADPFPHKSENQEFILAEHYDYKTGKGSIVKLNQQGSTAFLSANEHLSYPFSFIFENEAYFIPECHQSDKVDLYKIENQQPVFITTLIENFKAVDASMVRHLNKWFLFCTREDEYTNASLYIFWSDTLTGSFQPHGNNPVKLDIRNARPGGSFLHHEGKLYRVAQDCSESYGCAVIVNEIDILNTTEYREHAVQRIAPDKNWKYNKGLHTLTFINDQYVLIDAKRYSFSRAHFRKALSRKFGKLTGR